MLSLFFSIAERSFPVSLSELLFSLFLFDLNPRLCARLISTLANSMLLSGASRAAVLNSYISESVPENILSSSACATIFSLIRRARILSSLCLCLRILRRSPRASLLGVARDEPSEFSASLKILEFNLTILFGSSSELSSIMQ